MHGLSLEEIETDPFLMVVPEERTALRDRGWAMYDHYLRFQAISHDASPTASCGGSASSARRPGTRRATISAGPA